MREYRCEQDNKLLMKACLVNGDVEIKCKSCGTLNKYQAVDEEKERLLCRVENCPNRV